MLRILLLLFSAVQAETALPYASSSGLYFSYILKSVLLILLLLVFMFYWYRYLLPKMQGQGEAGRNLFLKERLVVEPGTTAYVLEIKGAYRLLVVSNKQTACYDLSGPKLKYPPAAPKKEFAAYLAEFSKNKDNPLKVLFKGKGHAKK
ncbi:MAG: hypothetical protein LBQ83_01175 [Candidatus Margulisbacteria bacterium]|jgi:hypothetical protein|nr:hypothetical protein [Candidatus Margulisiibacteriota bacterium]